MLRPSQVAFYAKKKENQNYRFRTWLKCNEDPDGLDIRFHRLHQELFGDYDCSRCCNCCKQYHGLIPEGDIKKDAACLQMTVEAFREQYLQPEFDYENEGYTTIHKPCDFLKEDGSCLLGACKPENCEKYPYTDQPDRLASMLSFLETVSVCPVAYEIMERLKDEYRFH